MSREQITAELAEMFSPITEILVMLSIGLFSSAVGYLYKVKEGRAFSFSAFFINMSVAVLMSFFVNSLLQAMSADLHIKLEMALMVVVGISANKLMELLQQKGLDLLFKRFLRSKEYLDINKK